MTIKKLGLCLMAVLFVFSSLVVFSYGQDDDSTRNVLKQGLLGAGTGAIASGVSGGNAGTGALVGAGTGVIGSALLDAITGPSSSSSSRRSAPPDDYYYADSPQDYYYEEEPPQESGTSKILKQGLLGAGTGAIASGVSGGNAGPGALVGAGTSIIGNALLDTITQPPQQRRKVYRRAPPPPQYPPQQQYQPQAYQQQYQPQNVKVTEEPVSSADGKKKIIKKYDANGKLVSEEEIYY
jgi:hypothetical protein